MGDYNQTPTLESIVQGLQSDVAALQRGTQQARTPVARAGLGSAFSVPNTTETAVAWDSAGVTNGYFEIDIFGPTPSRIGFLVDGRFDVFSQGEFASNATGYRSLRVVRNGTDHIAGDSTPALNGRTTLLSAAGHVIATAGDYLEMYCQQTSGGALNLLANYATFTVAAPLAVFVVYRGPA